MKASAQCATVLAQILYNKSTLLRNYNGRLGNYNDYQDCDGNSYYYCDISMYCSTFRQCQAVLEIFRTVPSICRIDAIVPAAMVSVPMLITLQVLPR